MQKLAKLSGKDKIDNLYLRYTSSICNADSSLAICVNIPVHAYSIGGMSALADSGGALIPRYRYVMVNAAKCINPDPLLLAHLSRPLPLCQGSRLPSIPR